MLFNSAIFAFGFLPVTFIVFFIVGRFSRNAAAAWLALASLFFYAWWNYHSLPLLVGAILFNYMAGRLISATDEPKRRRLITALAIGVNLILLGYFKYYNFFISIASPSYAVSVVRTVIPLGISFFTFTQIAFLADTFKRQAREPRFIHYALFVTYFPHLIAGPILHHKEMMPQFGDAKTYRPQIDSICMGSFFFLIGLVKKVIFADSIAHYATLVFSAAQHGMLPGLAESWGGAVAYTLQIYFDFSGYSDMAIGLSLLFGIQLPINFNSPYQSVSIIEFWRRWHMTLSRFLRDYLYIALGGNRKGVVRRYVNLMVTMLLGGLWHGAGWTFIIWGGLHGLYLIINHAWHAVTGKREADSKPRSIWTRGLSTLITLSAVIVAWVFFRADSFGAASRVLAGMAGLNGLAWSPHFLIGGARQYSWTIVLFGIALFLPNSQTVVKWLRDAYQRAPLHEPLYYATLGGLACIITLVIGIAESNSNLSEFIYFNF